MTKIKHKCCRCKGTGVILGKVHYMTYELADVLKGYADLSNTIGMSLYMEKDQPCYCCGGVGSHVKRIAKSLADNGCKECEKGRKRAGIPYCPKHEI